MKIGIEIAIAATGVILSGVVGHFVARVKLKDEIHKQSIEIERLKSRDDLQQSVIDEIKRQFDELLPVLIQKLEKKKKNGK